MVLSRGYPEEVLGHASRMPATSESGSMSDNSDNSYSPNDSLNMQPDDICRDYLRNVCKRGKRCKYRHPSQYETKELGKKHEYTFCHDFQNAGCRRPSCRFLHCTRDEEDYYKQAGQLPVRLQQAASLGIGAAPNEMPLQKGEIPVCKDYMKGQCMRAGRCKYRHVSSLHHDQETPTKAELRNGSVEHIYEAINGTELERYTTDYDSTNVASLAVASTKRRRVEESYTYVTYPQAQAPLDYTLILEENTMLRRKMEEFKKQVSDLSATNEVLLEQNARFRANKITRLISSVSSAPPVVAVSQVLTPTITPAPVMARSHIQPQPMGPLTTMAHIQPQPMGPLTTLAALTVNGASELVVSQPTMPPESVAMNPTQTIVPMTMSLENTMPGSNIPPGSMTQNMTVSMAQTTLPGASALIGMGLGSSLSSALVSYPIMSHCVTQMPTSLG